MRTVNEVSWVANKLILGRIIILRTSLLVHTICNFQKVTLNIGRVEMINAIGTVRTVNEALWVENEPLDSRQDNIS